MVGASLEGVRIARSHAGIVFRPVDLFRAGLRVVLRQQALDRFLRRDVGVAVVEIAIREREVHRLVDGVDVLALL